MVEAGLKLNSGLTDFKACVLTLGRVDSKGKFTGEEPYLSWEFQFYVYAAGIQRNTLFYLFIF